MFSLREVEKCFGEHRALSVPELDLAEGGVTAVVGPNGSGKTTLLRILAGADEPTSGRIRMPQSGARPDIVYVEQNPFLFRGTVESNVAYGLRAQRMQRSDRRRHALQALDRVGLSGLATRRSNRLSGGERRRVALARALVLSPRVLLLDEPFAEVDRGQVERLERLLLDQGRRGTVIFSTHDLVQAQRLAGRVVSLLGGRISPVSLVNMLRGSVILRDSVPVFRAGAIDLEVADPHEGATLAVIDPAAVFVSVEPVRSSARNSLPGIVRSVEIRGGLIDLTVDCGAPLVASVTRTSYEDLGLNVGRHVWLSLKSTAIHLY